MVWGKLAADRRHRSNRKPLDCQGGHNVVSATLSRGYPGSLLSSTPDCPTCRPRELILTAFSYGDTQRAIVAPQFAGDIAAWIA